MEILSLFACFRTLLAPKTIRRLNLISEAVFSMTGRVTMRGLSRWTGKGGSYRTVQRFFATTFLWTALHIEFVRSHLFNPDHEYIIAGDATTVTKAGTETFGINRFFSGVLGMAVRGLEFFLISLIDVTERKSYPLGLKQTVREEGEKAEKPAQKRKKKCGKKQRKTLPKKSPKLAGRPKGVPNKDKQKLELSGELLRINELLKTILVLLRVFVPVRYLAMDGHFGHNQAVLMARSNGLELISKLRRDAVLFEKYEGVYGGRGRRRQKGERLDLASIPQKYRVNSVSQKKGHLINYYQGVFIHPSFAMQLKVVIIEKIDELKQKQGHAILLSSDLDLSWEKIVQYYSLRFQIEFNFRDAKQHFGLEDFMNVTETGVENAANLSFLLVSVSAKLLKDKQETCLGINDLKSYFRGVKYARWIIKRVLQKAEPIKIEELIEEVGRIGSIHQPPSAMIYT